MFTIDGLQWDVACQVIRTAEITASEISGLLLDKTYFHDVLGTWMRYEVHVAVPLGRESDVTALYEALTAPVEGHTFLLPYNEETITVTGRVESVTDNWYPRPGGGSYWEGCTFTVLGNAPTKAMTLTEVITRGRLPVPSVPNVQEGTSYTYTENGWEESTYTDGDDISW